MDNIVACLFSSGGFDNTARGLLGVAQRLADTSSRRLCALVVGAEAESLATKVARAADEVTIADQTGLTDYQPEVWLTALTQLCRQLSPVAVLLSDATYSQEIAPRLAYRLGGSAVGDAVEVELLGGTVRAKRQVYGGKAQAVIELKCRPAVLWLRARSFQPAAPRATPGDIKRAAVSLETKARTRIVERRRDDTGQARLEDARVIVAGGRGLGGREPFVKDLQPLADLLGARMAATRAACDAGWVPASWQVGLTGKKVAPDLYLAVAISGASQHLAGISDAKNVAAINSDAEAPIFGHCQFGIVGDYRQVVPLLYEKLRFRRK